MRIEKNASITPYQNTETQMTKNNQPIYNTHSAFKPVNKSSRLLNRNRTRRKHKITIRKPIFAVDLNEYKRLNQPNIIRTDIHIHVWHTILRPQLPQMKRKRLPPITQEKAFKCDFCSFTTDYPDNLVRHLGASHRHALPNHEGFLNQYFSKKGIRTWARAYEFQQE